MPHQRRKSGPYSTHSSTTDVRKTVAATPAHYKRPAMTRRHTPSSAQKLGRGNREYTEVYENERESFPQFCMTCEKQFIPHGEMLYCSETCRWSDQDSSSQQPSSVHSYFSAAHTAQPNYTLGKPEPRDIVPRASPSRPSSMHFTNSPPATPGSTLNYHTSAMSALRSLNMRPPSPTSPTGSGIWPFSRSSATSPNNSYTRHSSGHTYDPGYGSAYSHEAASGGMERPLPPRNPGSSSSSRPKSIELLVPMFSR
ncbi:uncharacterized protein TrAtP1_000701 [Trichoderma atroviride]